MDCDQGRRDPARIQHTPSTRSLARQPRPESRQRLPRARGRPRRKRPRTTVRFSFREIPDAGRTTVRARPIVDLVVEGLDIAPHACLLDTGATAIRLGAHVAELSGIDTTKSLETK